MKLRILDDSIRLRLDREEVEAIGRGEAVIARTRLPGGRVFGYELHAAPETSATIDGSTIRVLVAAPDAARWAADDTDVSIRHQAEHVALLIEKDFECVAPREGESQANRFPNPKLSA